MDNLQPPSRTQGYYIPGKIIKGSSEPKFTAPSIPSKAKQCISYTQSANAFGTSSQRFFTAQKTAAGPGSYQLNVNPQNPSFSKKGFGPMISKMSRTLSVHNKGPGPLEYSQTAMSFFDKHSQRRAHIFSKSEAHGTYWSDHKDKINNPGPFQYSQPKTARISNLSSSSFKAPMKRWKKKATQPTPNPTSYNPKQTLIARRPKGMVIKQATSLNKESILQELFGKERDRSGPGQHHQQRSRAKPKRIKQTTGLRFATQPASTVSKISSIAHSSNYKEFLQASIARAKGYPSREHNG